MAGSSDHARSLTPPSETVASLLLQRPMHCALAYDTLAGLDLGADAANLYDGRPQPAWAPALHRAYLDAPGRLSLQAIALMVDNLDDLLALLGADLLPSLRDRPGRALQREFASVLSARREGFQRDWQTRSGEGSAHAQRWWQRWALTLRELDRALHQPSHIAPSELRVVACPALACSPFTHGRALDQGKVRWVAVALAGVDGTQALLQIVHELCHRFSDPPVRARFDETHDDTRAGAPLHRALEEAAVHHGGALLERAQPELMPAYWRWRARYGI